VLGETSPGRYEADVPLEGPGPYVLALQVASRDRAFEIRVMRGFYWSAARERMATGVNRDVLSAIAAASGGRVLAAGDDPFAVPRAPEYRDARPWLLAAALCLFLGETIAPAFVALRIRRRVRRGTGPRREAA
jgi:hypothetical protein